MTPRFTRRFRVRHYELDALGHLNNVVLVRYLQEAAIEASTALGFSPDWYRAHGALWVVRRLSVRYLAQATYGDELEITTWISTLGGVRSHRECDGARVARGRAEWVYIDMTTGQPTRVPDGWIEALETTGELEDLGIRLTNAQPTAEAHRYSSRRRVQFHELDAAQHVNHAVYLNWIGEGYFDAIRAAGHPLERTRGEGYMVFQAGHEIQYFAPAQANDPIEVVSWVAEMAKVRGAWTHEVYHADTRKLLARDYSVGVFVDLEGKPIVPPPQAIEDVVRGPTG
jgi:acyl-CoA thioester hydrolase